MPETWKEKLLRLAAETDWAQVAHTVSVFVRAARGDVDIQADQDREVRRVQKVRKFADLAARLAVGCTQPQTGVADDCAICREEQTK